MSANAAADLLTRYARTAGANLLILLQKIQWSPEKRPRTHLINTSVADMPRMKPAIEAGFKLPREAANASMR